MGFNSGFKGLISFHQRSILVFIDTLLLAQDKMGEAWEPSKKQCSFGSGEALSRELLSLGLWKGLLKQKRLTFIQFHIQKKKYMTLDVSKVVCFLLGNSPASEFYMPTFRNTLFHLHRQVGVELYSTPTCL